MNPIDIIRKYFQPDSDGYHILITHSQSVTQKALAIAQAHPELQADTDFIAEAAMLHDIGIVQCHAPKIGCFGTHKYIEHGYLGAAMLRAEGLERHALVAERHTGTGIGHLQIMQEKLPIPLGDYFPVSIEEKIICYADKFFSKSNIHEEKSIAQARISLSKFGGDTIARFDEWTKYFS